MTKSPVLWKLQAAGLSFWMGVILD
jgi:hypothetical protein